MCGICGYIGIQDDDLLDRMTASLHHRGPDSFGFFREEDVGLGSRRLSIIDVPGGDQPIENEDGNVVVIFNGEIYNYQPLREELLDHGHQFRTRSDTEVVLHLFEELGPACLQRLNGMFAIAIYDRVRRRLFLARDRLGIKPLYYVTLPSGFLFASEFKAILQYQRFHPTVNPQAIHNYLTLRYVPGPGGMFSELCKLPAAHYAIVENGKVSLHRYWQPELFTGPFPLSEEEYLEGFAERFEDSVRRRLIAEVPLGAYLSGGLDSSVVVAAFANLVSEPVRTFSVGFDFEHDELAKAAAMAKQLGCDHTEISCRVADIKMLPEIVYHLDEPIGDPIVIPMFELSREAKKRVTVVLTGEGADELLGGYLFHKALLMGYQLARVVPQAVRHSLLAPAVALTPAQVLNRAFDYPAELGQRGKLKVLDFLNMLEPDQLDQAYKHLISLFDNRDTQALYTDDFKATINGSQVSKIHHDIVASKAPYLNRILHLQFSHWLPEDILMKQDKMSMANGIEARVPFLDHELVEYALQIPPWLKIRRLSSKYILRKYARSILPRKISVTQKVPFYMPVEKYFDHPVFREMVHETLSERNIRERGILRSDSVSRLLEDMKTGEFMFVKQVFSLIMLELWFQMAVDRKGQL